MIPSQFGQLILVMSRSEPMFQLGFVQLVLRIHHQVNMICFRMKNQALSVYLMMILLHMRGFQLLLNKQ